MVFAGIAIFLYGCFIYRHIWSFFINQTIYTRKLNMTRAFLSKERISQCKVLLPISSEIPGFNEMGHLKQEFSKKGEVSWIRLANSIVIFLTILGFLTLLNKLNLPCGFLRIFYIWISIIFSFIGFMTSYFLHNNYDQKIINGAENYWKQFMNDLNENT